MTPTSPVYDTITASAPAESPTSQHCSTTPALSTAPYTVFQTALAARLLGISVVPPRQDGTKAPDGCWAEYQKRIPGLPIVQRWYDSGLTGVGFVTGRVSGNLECFEFDDAGTYDQFKVAADVSGLGELVERIEAGYCERTPSGGVHWLYRCETISGNTKLAQRSGPTTEDGKPTRKTLIETRGQGGYVIAAPSHGTVHPSGKPYESVSGGLPSIVTITSEERADLWDLARAFDAFQDRQRKPITDRTPGKTGTRPRDVFNERATWGEILEPHGWTYLYTHGGTEYWRRPGKREGISATVNFGGSDLLYVFSSSTPLEPDTGYSKFAAYAHLNHDGDFTAAARALAEQGYGSLTVRSFNLTDLGNAERLVHRHGDDLLHCEPLGGWLIWDGQRWTTDATGEVQRRAKDTIRSIYGEASAEESDDRRRALSGHARASESGTRIRQAIALAESESGVKVTPDRLDTDPHLLNVLNGTLDLRTGDLLPHRREHRISKLAPVEYHPQATCPTWESFLGRIFAGNEGVIRWVQKAVGYSLTGLTVEQVLFFLHGYGANGKSTFIETLQDLLGDYGRQADFTTFLARQRDSGPRDDIADLRGARLVSAVEVGDGRRLDEMLVKQMTGGDTVKARHLYGKYFTFKPTFKIFLAANHKPHIGGDDEGIWRRIRLIPFTVTIPGAERDRGLGEKLRAELSGILRWAVDGCLAWQREGLGVPPEVEAATQAYRAEMDVLTEFVDEWCELDPRATTRSSALHNAYLAFCREKQIRFPLSQARLKERLESRGLVNRKSNGIMTWFGLDVLRFV